MVNMALSEIEREIKAQAHKEADGVRKSAGKERDAILDEAAAQVKSIAKQVEAEIKDEAARMKEESSASAELAAKNIVLRAREEALEAEMSHIRAELIRKMHASPAYAKLFKAAVAQAREIAPLADLTAFVESRDKGKVAAGIKTETRDVGGGILIKSRSGDIEINATLGNLVESKSEEIRNAIMGRMFGSRSAGVKTAGRRAKRAVAAKKPRAAKKSKPTRKARPTARKARVTRKRR